MYSDLFSQFTDANKNFLNPLNQLSSLNTKVAESLTRQQISAANELIGLGVKHAQTLASTKKIEDVVGLNTAFLSEAGNKYAECVSQLFETALKVSGEYTKLFEEGFRGVSAEVVRKSKAA
jgi:phasin family protein